MWAANSQMEAKLPIHERDGCAALLIPLNECRRAAKFVPWKCGDVRHMYEKCLYKAYVARVQKMSELKASA